MIKHYVIEVVFQIYKFFLGRFEDGIYGWVLVKEYDDKSLVNQRMYFKKKVEINFIK